MMDWMEAIRARHSVRAYTDAPLAADVREALEAEINQCNDEGGLSMRLVCDEPEAFDSTLAHYGKFLNVRNYIVLAGRPAPDLDERCGYYGERVVLQAQRLGLNTCWVALTFKKRFVKKMLAPGDQLCLVIAVGYGATQGSPRKSKAPSDVSRALAYADTPEWFDRGVEAALLAPTAINQQKFDIAMLADCDDAGRPLVSITARGGSYTNIDLGIARLHFELGANPENFTWENPLKKMPC